LASACHLRRLSTIGSLRRNGHQQVSGSRHQMEVVGLLAVHRASPSVLRLTFLPNRTHAPCTWQLHSKDILLARRRLAALGLRTVGLFCFTRPVSSAVLGPRDRRNTPTRWTHLVYDVCALEPRLYLLRWQDERRKVQELHLTVERSRRRGVGRTDDVADRHNHD
jgi:hypothetical protein